MLHVPQFSQNLRQDVGALVDPSAPERPQDFCAAAAAGCVLFEFGISKNMEFSENLFPCAVPQVGWPLPLDSGTF